MEPFKNLLNATLVHRAAAALQRHDARFDAQRFAALASTGLDALEMKGRALHICAALEATLPPDFDAAAALIEAALAPVADIAGEPVPGQIVNGGAGDAEGLKGWILWPAGEFIARRGLAQPERALRALHALTQRFSAEFAIRPFIATHPELVFATLARWCTDPSAHVRRLVSEGSRPRLPWGLQLKALIADPSPTLPLLRALQDDPSAYVRRSVANHLNDIAKDHPALIAAWLDRHLADAGAERRALLRHASRTLIKRGDTAVLRAWGMGARFHGRVGFTIAPARVTVGGELQLSLVLESASRQAQKLVIDYAVHHVKADGRTTPKVFKGWTLELPPGGRIALARRHSMKPVTTRRYHAGRHAVTLHVNGQPLAEAAFELRLPRPAKAAPRAG